MVCLRVVGELTEFAYQTLARGCSRLTLSAHACVALHLLTGRGQHSPSGFQDAYKCF